VPGRLLRRLRSIPAPLALVLAAAAIVATAWALLLPPFQGPDESEHFAYVQHVAETGGAPSSTTFGGAGSHSSEQTFAMDALGLRMLMASPSARPLWNELDQARWRQFEQEVSERQRADGEGANPIAKNPPLYYAYEALAYRAAPGDSLYDDLLASRLANVLLFLTTVACAWLAAAELTARVWVRTLTAAVVAVQPQLTSMAGIVNADTLLVTVWSAFTALALRTLVRGPSLPRIVGLSALAAASALTHGRGLALLPPLLAVVALACWRHRPELRETLRWSAAGVGVLAIGLVLFRLFAAGGGSGGSLYGNQTDYINQGGFGIGQFAQQVWQFYLPELPFLPARVGPDYGFRQMFVETFFGSFGWLEVRFPQRVYTALRIGLLLGLAGLVVAGWARRRLLREQLHVVLGLLAICGSLLVLLHLVSYLALLGSGDPLIVGRYALPLIVPFALAVAFLATSLPRRAGALFGVLVVTAGIVLQLSGLLITVERFYA
jgi:4-amino-4-deoxy-L-arabinose transferase-like glycosyltransferase